MQAWLPLSTRASGVPPRLPSALPRHAASGERNIRAQRGSRARPERPAPAEPPPGSSRRRGGTAPEPPRPENLWPRRSFRPAQPGQHGPSLPRPRSPSTSRAMSEGNNMTEAAAGTATGDETQVQSNTAPTAPAPHLPVPVAALNPRQFVPPLSPRVRQSLSRKKERRRNETRLRSPRNCRHFRPESRRGGAEGVEEVGGRRSGRRQGAGGERRLARHWREARRRVCSDEPNILKRESARSALRAGVGAHGQMGPAPG